jgi:hypothetical protein
MEDRFALRIINGVDAMSAVTDRPKGLAIKSQSIEVDGVRLAHGSVEGLLDQRDAAVDHTNAVICS